MEEIIKTKSDNFKKAISTLRLIKINERHLSKLNDAYQHYFNNIPENEIDDYIKFSNKILMEKLNHD